MDALTRTANTARLAPSAENLQPWRFQIDDECILVSLDLSRQLPSDIGHMLGLTGIGAAIENATLAASLEHLRTDIQVLSPPGADEIDGRFLSVVRMRFSGGGDPNPLAEQIPNRCTSRRMNTRRVEPQLLSELSRCVPCGDGVQLQWVEESQLPEFAALVGLGNQIRFEYQPYHAELYHSLRFAAEEVERTKDGLDVATLQLPVGAASLMHFLRKWPRMKWANALGFSRGVARQATSEVIKSGAVGFLTVADNGFESFIGGGGALERLWLTATQLDLRFHPTASLAVFLAHARSGGRQLSTRHQRVAMEMSDRFYRLFPAVEGRVVQMAFRLGYGELPPVRSIRRRLESVVEYES